MRPFLLLILATALCRASQPVALEFVGCENIVNHINVVAGTARGLGIPDIEATQDGCAAQDAIRISGNKAVILVKTQQSVSTDETSTFELHRYDMPSWKLEAKRAIQGKLPSETRLLPGSDGKSFVAVSFSDDRSRVVSRLAYSAGGLMEPLPIDSIHADYLLTNEDLRRVLNGPRRSTLLPYTFVASSSGQETLGSPIAEAPGASLYALKNRTDPSSLPEPLAIIFADGGVRIIDRTPFGRIYLAQARDAVLIHANSPLAADKTRLPTDQISVYSADTGKETASMIVPVLANKDARCIALWHDKVAVFLLPKSYVVVNFAKKTFKVIANDGELDRAVNSHALWVEADDAVSARNSPSLKLAK